MTLTLALAGIKASLGYGASRWSGPGSVSVPFDLQNGPHDRILKSPRGRCCACLLPCILFQYLLLSLRHACRMAGTINNGYVVKHPEIRDSLQSQLCFCNHA